MIHHSIWCGGSLARLNPSGNSSPLARPTNVLKMQNNKGEVVDLYIPRKCSATNQLITGKDHSSVQINIGRVDANGVLTGEFDTIAMCGFIRSKGLSDDAFYRVSKEKGYFTPYKAD